MAKKAKKNVVEIEPPPTMLAGSYTQETAGNLLRKNGVMLRHKDVKKELFSKDSIYKQLMLLPALAIHNQNLVLRIMHTKNYVQEKLTNIIFAVTAVRAKDPSNKKPLSEKRQSLYTKVQKRCNVTSREVFQLSRRHETLYTEIFEKVGQNIEAWRKLCRDSAETITQALRDKGFELPKNFSELLQKHLECSGSNEISANELSEMNIKSKLDYAEMALVCALKEAEKHGDN